MRVILVSICTFLTLVLVLWGWALRGENSHSFDTDVEETLPIWYGGKFDLIYDTHWASYPESEAYLTDDDYLFVTGNGPYESDIVYGLRFVGERDWENYASNNLVKVTLVAKSATAEPIRFRIAYVTNDRGFSGWKEFVAGHEFTEFSFEYRVPKLKHGNKDFINVVPDVTAKGQGVFIREAFAEVINK